MAEECSQRGAYNSKDGAEDSKLQPADFPTSSLASLHLRDDDVVINEGTNHMLDNPELYSVVPVTTSSPLNQSQRQKDISVDTRPEPSPAVHGKISGDP